MRVHYKLITTLNLLEPSAKAQEIIQEVRERFGEKVVNVIANTLVSIDFRGELPINEMGRLDQLIGRLADLARAATIVISFTNGIENRVRIIGPTAQDVELLRRLNFEALASKERRRNKPTSLGLVCGDVEQEVKCHSRR